MQRVPLVPFKSDSASEAPLCAKQCKAEITVIVALDQSEQEITAEFTLQGDTSTIQWPTPLPQPIPGDELWKHTCFELFIADSHSPAYWEYNFSPSRQWAIYAFRGYRQPAGTPISTKPTIGTPCLTDKIFSIKLNFPLERPLANKPLSIGACAVIENRDGSLQYFALTHGTQRPDFHQRDSFLIKIN